MTFLPLGIVFSVVFGALGFVFLAVGLVVHPGDHGRSTPAAAHAAARRDRARLPRPCPVVEAKHNYGSQIGARHPVTLTVDLAGGRYTRSLLVVSHIDWKPGETIEVKFAPDDPANFVPVT